MGCERQQERGSISLPDPPVHGFHASPFCTGTLGTVADSWLQSQSSERRSGRRALPGRSMERVIGVKAIKLASRREKQQADGNRHSEHMQGGTSRIKRVGGGQLSAATHNLLPRFTRAPRAPGAGPSGSGPSQ